VFLDFLNYKSDPYLEQPTLWCSLGFAAHAISEELASLVEISEVTENGAHYPLFMLILQQLYKTQGKTRLTQLFNDSKVRYLWTTLPCLRTPQMGTYCPCVWKLPTPVRGVGRSGSACCYLA